MPATSQASEAIHKTKPEAARYLHISERTLDRLDIPRVKLRGKVLYRTETLDAWSKAQEVPTVVAR